MSELLAGIDIGGTKCAVCLGVTNGDQVEIVAKRRFPTPPTPEATLAEFFTALRELVAEQIAAAGHRHRCGSRWTAAGIVLSPPNLPGWINVPAMAAFCRTVRCAGGAAKRRQRRGVGRMAVRGRGPRLPEHHFSDLWHRYGRRPDPRRAALQRHKRHGRRSGPPAPERNWPGRLWQSRFVRGLVQRRASSGWR